MQNLAFAFFLAITFEIVTLAFAFFLAISFEIVKLFFIQGFDPIISLPKKLSETRLD